MNEQEWVPLKKGAKENSPALKKVKESGLKTLRGVKSGASQRFSSVITYETNGFWKKTFSAGKMTFDLVDIPRAGRIADEGLPELPQEGIFVAIPKNSGKIKIKVTDKKLHPLPGKFAIRPAPKPITEGEYLQGKERFQTNSKIYDSDSPFPGKDAELIGQKTIEGIPVAHIMLYPAQYRPKSGSLAFIQSMTIEVSYEVKPDRDVVPDVRLITPVLSDMILDHENISSLPAEKELGLSPFQYGYTGEQMGGILPSPGIVREPSAEVDAVLKRNDIISEYVIITPASLAGAVDPLRKAKAGWPHYAMVATTETINSEFPSSNLKESIRSFLSWAWENWKVPPRFVVLAGDVDILPTHLWSVGGATFASDHYYADMRNNLSPEIVVSRIPTSDSTRMQQICQQLIQYRGLRGPDWGGWVNQVVLVAYEGDTYKQCSDEISTIASPRFRITKLYGDSTSRQQVIDRMNAGVLIANYRGHGDKTEWLSANGLRSAEIRSLNNGSMPPMVFCICCRNAWIDDQSVEVVAETFLRDRKCVAVFGASRDSPTYANNDFNKYLWQAIMDGEVTPGNIVLRAKALMVQNHANSYTHNQDVVMYMLFGDPTANITSDVEFLRGGWNMDHDGWKGTLAIDRIWQSRVEKVSACGYPVWSFSGSYTGQDGKKYEMVGKIGGNDPNDKNPGCKRSDHRVLFTISFPGNKQDFQGYITTWTRNAMAGYTWWSNRPFGWYAKKKLVLSPIHPPGPDVPVRTGEAGEVQVAW
jgi:hypothetical protein